MIIDSEKLKRDLIQYQKSVGVCYGSIMALIDKQPQADVLDKIRAEIEMMNLGDFANVCIKAHNNAIDDVLKIIDKYKAESEGKRNDSRKENTKDSY